MYVWILSILVAIICLLIGKRRSKNIKRTEMIHRVLWIEACFFLIVYVITGSDAYKKTWLIFLLLASLFVFIKEIINKKIEN